VTQKSLEMCPVCLCHQFCGPFFGAADQILERVMSAPAIGVSNTGGFGGGEVVTLTTLVL